MLHCLIRVNSAAAGCDNGFLGFKVGQNLVLDLNETVGTHRVDDGLQGFVHLLLNNQVGINEFQGHDLGQNDAQRGLARTGHSDKNDVALLFSHMALLIRWFFNQLKQRFRSF